MTRGLEFRRGLVRSHVPARQGEDLKLAAELAERGGAADEPRADLVRALVHGKRGQRGPARKLLRATRDAEGVDDLREEVETALEEI